MNNWLALSSATKGLDLLFISLFFSFVLIAIGTFIKWLKPTKGAFSTKKGLVLEFDKNNQSEEEIIRENKVSLFACIDESPSFRNELTLVISKSIRFGYEIALLKEVITIRNQMNSAQVKADLIKNIFLRGFSAKQLDLRKDNMADTNFAYEIFNEFIIQIIKINILDDMKMAFKQNGLVEFNDDDYENIYCKDRVKKILTNLRMHIHNSLPDNLNPSIADIIEVFDKYETQISNYLKEALLEARKIASKYHEEEEERKHTFDQEILDATGFEKASRSGK